MRRALALALALAAALAEAPPEAAESRDPYGSSVVGLAITFQGFDEDRPWEKTAPSTRRALAAVVEGPYLLTTAEMVAGATLIQVEKFGRAAEAPARVVHVDREADLALLDVADPSFLADLAPVKLAGAMPLDDPLRTVRWRNQQLEVSSSRIKRFEVQEAWFGELRHVFALVQTDLSGGGWAEPVFAGDALAGLTVSQNEQTARVIPVEILRAYLERARAGVAYRGFPDLGARWQVNEDAALARFLGQEGEPSGVLIRQVPLGSSGSGVLEPRDILLSLDGRAIDRSGYYAHPRFGRIEFSAILTEEHRVGDVLPAQVLRGGKVIDVRIPLREYPAGLDLVPVRRGDDPPPYLVAGGLVFRELDGDYLRSWGRDWMKKAPLQILSRFLLSRSSQEPGKLRIVVLKGVLPSPYNLGYHDLSHVIVERVNGRSVDSIAAAAEAFRHPEGGFHTIELIPNGGTSLVVLDAERLEEATKATLEEYGIPAAVKTAASAPPPLGDSD